jgi:hypothetical protein
MSRCGHHSSMWDLERWLGHLPLAIDQAGSYMHKSKILQFGGSLSIRAETAYRNSCGVAGMGFTANFRIACKFCKERGKECDSNDSCRECEEMGFGKYCTRPESHIEPSIISTTDQSQSNKGAAQPAAVDTVDTTLTSPRDVDKAPSTRAARQTACMRCRGGFPCQRCKEGRHDCKQYVPKARSKVPEANASVQSNVLNRSDDSQDTSSIQIRLEPQSSIASFAPHHDCGCVNRDSSDIV